MRLDLWLEQGRSPCFALWTLMFTLSVAPELDVAFENPEGPDATRNLIELFEKVAPADDELLGKLEFEIARAIQALYHQDRRFVGRTAPLAEHDAVHVLVQAAWRRAAAKLALRRQTAPNEHPFAVNALKDAGANPARPASRV